MPFGELRPVRLLAVVLLPTSQILIFDATFFGGEDIVADVANMHKLMYPNWSLIVLVILVAMREDDILTFVEHVAGLSRPSRQSFCEHPFNKVLGAEIDVRLVVDVVGGRPRARSGAFLWLTGFIRIVASNTNLAREEIKPILIGNTGQSVEVH